MELGCRRKQLLHAFGGSRCFLAEDIWCKKKERKRKRNGHHCNVTVTHQEDLDSINYFYSALNKLHVRLLSNPQRHVYVYYMQNVYNMDAYMGVGGFVCAYSLTISYILVKDLAESPSGT